MLTLKQFFEGLGVGQQGFSLIVLFFMFSFVVLSILIMLAMMLKKVKGWFKEHPAQIMFPDTQEPRRGDDKGMLMRFFDALRIGPLARSWMGILFIFLMIEFSFRLGVWLFVNAPGRFTQEDVSIPLTVEPAQSNAEQGHSKSQPHSIEEPTRNDGQSNLQ